MHDSERTAAYESISLAHHSLPWQFWYLLPLNGTCPGSHTAKRKRNMFSVITIASLELLLLLGLKLSSTEVVLVEKLANFSGYIQLIKYWFQLMFSGEATQRCLFISCQLLVGSHGTAIAAKNVSFGKSLGIANCLISRWQLFVFILFLLEI